MPGIQNLSDLGDAIEVEVHLFPEPRVFGALRKLTGPHWTSANVNSIIRVLFQNSAGLFDDHAAAKAAVHGAAIEDNGVFNVITGIAHNGK